MSAVSGAPRLLSADRGNGEVSETALIDGRPKPGRKGRARMKPESHPRVAPLFGFGRRAAVVMSAVSGTIPSLRKPGKRRKQGKYKKIDIKRGKKVLNGLFKRVLYTPQFDSGGGSDRINRGG
jgi:hypothetical protein